MKCGLVLAFVVVVAFLAVTSSQDRVVSNVDHVASADYPDNNDRLHTIHRA